MQAQTNNWKKSLDFLSDKVWALAVLEVSTSGIPPLTSFAEVLWHYAEAPISLVPSKINANTQITYFNICVVSCLASL